MLASCIVPKGLGHEALQHASGVDRQSNLLHHAALSPYPLPRPDFTPYSYLLAAADGIALPLPAEVHTFDVSDETVPAVAKQPLALDSPAPSLTKQVCSVALTLLSGSASQSCKQSCNLNLASLQLKSLRRTTSS